MQITKKIPNKRSRYPVCRATKHILAFENHNVKHSIAGSGSLSPLPATSVPESTHAIVALVALLSGGTEVRRCQFTQRL